jgi:type II secretory pathway predicted ATPase ExeA
MFKLTSLETFVNCGFTTPPFANKTFETGDSIRIKRILSLAIQSRAMISIIGDRGMGKTKAIAAGLRSFKARMVIVRSADKNKLLISHIEKAMILELSDENPKADREIRARQLRRILGEVSVKQEVVLVIEEGHRLHGNTLRSLKTLREMDWMGKTELFTVILAGQSDPMSKAGVSEVRLRSDSVHMKGLSMDEAGGYIQNTVGKVFENSAIDMIAAHGDVSNFLELQEILVDLMGRMLAEGKEKVDEDIVAETLDIDRPAIPRKRNVTPVLVPEKDVVEAGNDTLKSFLKERKDGAVEMPKAVNG